VTNTRTEEATGRATVPTWSVEVGNLDTGETQVVEVEAAHREDAEHAGLVKAFRGGWRRTRLMKRADATEKANES
jgi:hypothetical protein